MSKAYRPFLVFAFLAGIIAVFFQAPAHFSYGNVSLVDANMPEKAAGFIARKQLERKEHLERKLEESIVPGEVIVKLKTRAVRNGFFAADPETRSKVQSLSRRYSLIPKSKVNLLGQVVFQSKAKKAGDILRLVSELEKDPDVEYAEPNFIVRAFGEKVPWGVSKVEATQAWAQNGVDGAGVVVAVVDTGVDYNHPDIDDNIWMNDGEISGNGIDDDGNGFVDDRYGWDFAGWNFEFRPDNDPMDEIGHGTHVAGIIAAERNGRYVVGVAPKARIMAVKVFTAAGYATARTVADGILYAASNGADVINLSLGTYYYSRAMEEAVKYATSRGAVVVAAAGNDWWDLPSYPAAYEDVISVGSVDSSNERSWFSNFGKIDLVAPGSSVESLQMDGRTVVYSGTSMAAPHVCGVAALVLQKNPSFDARQVRQVLESSAVDLGKPGKDFYFGSGLVNAPASSDGTYSSSVILMASDRAYLFADGEDEKEVKIRAYDGNLNPVAGLRVDLSATNSIPSSPHVYTNSSGEAIVSVVTAERRHVTNITAESTAAPVASLDLMIKRTDVALQNVWVSTENDESGYSKLNSYFKPGQKIFLMFDLFNHYYEPVEATVSFEVRDPEGNAVQELSGRMKKTITGENYGWFPFIDLYMPCGQDWLSTGWLTLPEGLEPGIYTVEASVTANGRVSEFSFRFNVLQPSTVLIYGASERRYYDRGSGFEIFSSVTHGGYFVDALNHSGYTYTYWDRDLEGPMDFEGMPVEEPESDSVGLSYDGGERVAVDRWPLILVFDPEASWLTLQGSLNTYLIKGGKVFVTSERPFTYGQQYYEDSPFFQMNLKQKPQVPAQNPFGVSFEESVSAPKRVLGTAGGPFEGAEIDVHFENWEGEGAANQLIVDSFASTEGTFSPVLRSPVYGEVQFVASARPLFEFENGKLAGIAVDTSHSYQGLLLTFGVEGMNSASQRRTIVKSLLDWFFEVPEITGVQMMDLDTWELVPKILTSGRYILKVEGRNFTPLGSIQVLLGDCDLAEFVTRRTRCEVEIEVDGSLLEPGLHALRIVNADGKHVEFGQPIEVEAGARRIFGENRIKTAVEVSRAHFKESPNVIIATGFNFADSLSAVPLARFLNCPVLLAHPDRLPEEVLEEIRRLNATSVVIVGGEGAVSSKVASVLEENGMFVERIGGRDRYETSALIAERLAQALYIDSVPKVYVTTGENFADAISASPLAASEFVPVVLVRKSSIPAPVMEFLTNYSVGGAVVVGGTGAVSAAVEQSLPGSVTRIAGRDRYETSVRAAEHAISSLGFDPKVIYIATGERYPDALTSGVCAAMSRNPLVLVKPNLPLSQSTEQFVWNLPPLKLIKVIGGEGAVSQEVVDRILELAR